MPPRTAGAVTGRHRPRRRYRAPLWARLCTVLGAFLLLGSTGIGAAAYGLAERYDNNIDREDFLGSVGKGGGVEPESTVTGPFNLLLLGSDVRKGRDADPAQGERADTIMLVHVPRGLDRAYVVSLPRDSWVDVPALDGRWDGGPAKINAAFDIGGVPHMVRTVQELTGLETDYVVTLDFEGFKDITDAVGGVDMDVPIATKSIHTNRSWSKGRHHFNGAEALDYVRQRKQYRERGDLQRIDNQQAFVRALLSKVVSTGRLSNPVALDKLLTVTTGAITVDKRTPVKALAFALRGIRPADLSFTTLPVASFATRAGQSVVLVDEDKADALFSAVRDETLDAWLLDNPPAPAG